MTDLLRAAIFAAAHLLGGSVGAGIIAVSLGVRLALLPLTVRLARRSLAHQARLARIEPELQRLRARYANDPAALSRHTLAAYRRAGVPLLDPVGLLGGLVQLPAVAGVFAAVRQGLGATVSFLWIPNLFRPDLWLAIGVAALTAVATYIGARIGQAPPARTSTMAVWLSACFVFLAAWRASAAVALSWGAGSVGAIVQAIVMRRTRRDDVRRG